MKKTIITVFICLAILAGGGYGVYKLYIVPRYIEPALEQTANALNSDETKEKIDDIISELVKNGVITEDDAEKYYSNKSLSPADKINSPTTENTANGAPQSKDSGDDTAVSEEASSDSDNSSSVDSDNTVQTEKNSSQIAASEPSQEQSGGDSADKAPSSKSEDNLQDSSEKSLYDKVKSEVGLAEAQELYSVYSQYSFLAGMSTDEIKAYAKENMSQAEIQHLLDLYSKYSGLLN